MRRATPAADFTAQAPSRFRAILPGLAAFALCIAMAASARASSSLESVLGVWLVASKSGHVEISRCGDSVCGTIIWLKEERPGQTILDARNKDPTARVRPIRGSQMLWGFSPGQSGWVHGRIYNAQDGNTYRAELMAPGPDILKVKGCAGPICQTQTWRRVR
jgi:uncharacterized protein (DUF2147 family)